MFKQVQISNNAQIFNNAQPKPNQKVLQFSKMKKWVYEDGREVYFV